MALRPDVATCRLARRPQVRLEVDRVTAALTGLPLLALLAACFVALVVLVALFIAAGRDLDGPCAVCGNLSCHRKPGR